MKNKILAGLAVFAIVCYVFRGIIMFIILGGLFLAIAAWVYKQVTQTKSED